MAGKRSHKNKSLSTRQVYGFLGVVCLLAVVLGAISLDRIINNPAEQTKRAREETLSRQLEANLAQEEYLREQDTDQDGLTDYEELSVYGTSPYLADSDSDGFNDKQEIDTENDPNCPAGDSCRSSRIETPSEQEQNLQNFGADQFSELLKASEAESENAALEQLDLTNLTPAELRALLLETGQLTQEQLDQIDDDTLSQVYQEVISGSDN